MGAVAGGEHSGQAAAIRLAGHGDWAAPGITLEEIAGGEAWRLVRGRSTRQGLHVDRDQRDCSPASRHPARASRRQEGGRLRCIGLYGGRDWGCGCWSSAWSGWWRAVMGLGSVV